MSHWSEVKTQVKDVAALTAAATEMGLTVEATVNTRRPTIRGYGTMSQEVDIAVKLTGRYDLGFIQQENGSYQMVTDWWGGDVAREVGEGAGKLLQNYAYHAVASAARLAGMSVYREVQDDGAYMVVLQEQG
jgi:hypothetical protein